MRMAGVNIGKVKQKELGPGGRTTVRRDGARPPLRADRARRARDPAPEEPPRRDLRGDHAGQPGRARSSPTAGRWPSAQVDDSVELDEVFRVFDPETREGVPAVAPRGRHRHERHLRARLQRLARERRAVLHGRRRPAAAAGRAGGGAPAGVPRHRPRLPRRVARGRPAERADHERQRDLRRARVARRRARRDVPDLPDLPARDARDGAAARGVRREHRPARARPALSRRATSRRRCATSATLSPDLEHLFNHIHPLVRASQDRRAGGHALPEGRASRCSRPRTSSCRS